MHRLPRNSKYGTADSPLAFAPGGEREGGGMREKAAAVAVLCLLIAVSISALPSVTAGRAPSQPKWLELIYLDADNSLDVSAGPHHVPVVQSDLDELMSVGSTKDVVVYVLLDRYDGPANLFRINKGSMTEMTAFALDGKEVNMGDPAVLHAFVSFTTKQTPALQTLLIFWDHGTPEYAAYDDHAGPGGGVDILTHQEVVAGLDGFHIDVLGADECLVGQTEVAYEYATKLGVDYGVLSETYTGWRGFPYDWTLRDLVADPMMTPREVAVMIVEETQTLISQNPYQGEEVTSHGAIDFGKMRELAGAITDLVGIMTPNMKDYASAVSKAAGAARYSYGANALNLADLRTFVEKLGSVCPDQSVKDAAAKVIAVFDQTIVALQVTQTVDHQINGLGICIPNHSWEMPGFYMDFAFPYLGWYDFLVAYWTAAGSI